MSLSSYLGQYVSQSLLHSLIVALVVEALIRAWRIRAPRVRLRLHSLVLILPTLAFPVFQLLDSTRGTAFFREHLALFDSFLWLRLPLWDHFFLGYLPLVVMGGAAVAFVLQELIPFVEETMWETGTWESVVPGRFPKLDTALARVSAKIPVSIPPVSLTSGDMPTVYISSLVRPRLVISRSFIDLLTERELEGVLAHELAHMLRHDIWKGWVLTALRLLQFYNPIVLLVFRRITQDGEMTCDDLAVSWTKDPDGYAESLQKVSQTSGEGRDTPQPAKTPGGLGTIRSRLETHSERVLIKERVERLGQGSEISGRESFEAVRFGLAVSLILILLFFVV